MKKTITQIVALDLSDTSAEVCILDLDASSSRQEELNVSTLRADMEAFFHALPPSRVVMEAGTHSPWLSRVAEISGHEVRVVDPRRLKLITENARKSDKVDAELLARMGRIDDVDLMRCVDHRSERLHADYAHVCARDKLVQCRTMLINFARGIVKSFGGRLPNNVSTASFATRADVLEAIPEIVRVALRPLMWSIATLTQYIKEYDKTIERVLETSYAEENQCLRQIKGVGALTALSFICVVQSPDRFESSVAVGSYVGLSPGRKQSGQSDPKRGITKQGDALLRCQLTRAANYILNFGPDSDIKRHGQKLIDRGKPKNVAICAMARKIAVVMHRLWATHGVYEPLYLTNKRQKMTA